MKLLAGILALVQLVVLLGVAFQNLHTALGSPVGLVGSPGLIVDGGSAGHELNDLAGHVVGDFGGVLQSFLSGGQAVEQILIYGQAEDVLGILEGPDHLLSAGSVFLQGSQTAGRLPLNQTGQGQVVLVQLIDGGGGAVFVVLEVQTFPAILEQLIAFIGGQVVQELDGSFGVLAGGGDEGGVGYAAVVQNALGLAVIAGYVDNVVPGVGIQVGKAVFAQNLHASW